MNPKKLRIQLEELAMDPLSTVEIEYHVDGSESYTNPKTGDLFEVSVTVRMVRYYTKGECYRAFVEDMGGVSHSLNSHLIEQAIDVAIEQRNNEEYIGV